MTAYEFIINERGILPETLESFGVHEVEGWLRFPYPNGSHKERLHDDSGKRQFRHSGGSITGLFGADKLSAGDAVFLVEGESDTLRLWQELRSVGSHGSVVGLSGINTWKSHFANEVGDADVCYVILDNDDDYKVQAQVEKTWLQIRKDLGRKARRIRLPDDVKDICEFFDKYTVDTLRMLAERGKDNPLWNYNALDLTQEPHPPDWLIEDLLCKGDLAMMIGEPGIGKSWVSMALAVAIAEGHPTFLGRPLTSGGRVLCVDEENPEALIPLRLRKLGLTDEGAKNIRYLHRQGVRLDRHPELILEEALEWEPTLIVLDSLTRLHTKDENNAGEVAGLFNDGIVPLARETGATCLILHHVNKSDGGSSFTRARGSGDLSASIDTGFDIRGSDSQNLSAYHYKSRWIAEGTTIRFRIEDTPDGGVQLVTAPEPKF